MQAATILAVGMLIAASAHAQAAAPNRAPPPDIGQTTAAPFVQSLPQTPPTRPRLFTIAGVPVYLWAPVEAPYNGNMNRNQAANPVWEVDAY